MTIAPDRIALVTGGASGFGLEIARQLIAAEAHVVLADVDVDRLGSAAASLGPGVVAVGADVRSGDALGAAVTRCVDAFGGLDTLIVSAGVIRFAPLDDVTEDDWDLTLDVNLKGAFLAAKVAAPELRRSGRGRIVNIASDAGRRGAPFIHPYVASKFGLVGITESLAAELAAAGVTVNCVCPVGCPTTGMGEQVLAWKVAQRGADADRVVRDAASGNPIGRNATPADVAAATLFFVSDEASFLTGVALDVDGGLHLAGLPGLE